MVGRCQEVLTRNSVVTTSSRTLATAAPLCGVTKEWSTLGGDMRSFAQVVKNPTRSQHKEGRKPYGDQRNFRGGRSMGGRGGRWEEENQQMNQHHQGGWDDRRGPPQGGRHPN